MGHVDFALFPESLFFQCQKLELTNIHGTVPQFILKTSIYSILQYFQIKMSKKFNKKTSFKKTSQFAFKKLLPIISKHLHWGPNS